MEVLNWMAEHWLLTIVLAMIVSGAVSRWANILIIACSK